MSRNVVSDRHHDAASAQDQLKKQISQLEDRIRQRRERLRFENPYDFSQKRERIELAYDQTRLRDLRALLTRAPVDEWRPASAQVFETPQVAGPKPRRQVTVALSEQEATEARARGISLEGCAQEILRQDPSRGEDGVVVTVADEDDHHD
jgi:hypothetical protein